MQRVIDPILVDEPRETLDIEVKEWLDLTDNDQRAILARSVIALANQGGGHLVVGFRESASGSFEDAPGRPDKMDAWAQDAIQSIVAKYVEPAIQCQVSHIPRSRDGLKYQVIAVPGGHIVPVRAKAGSPDGKLVANRAYVRRAGPASEEPRTADEWIDFSTGV